LPRSRGYGRRTVEQTRSVDIRELRKAAYVGKPSGNWLEARNKLFRAGIRARHWNDEAITLDGQKLAVAWAPWHFGGSRPFFVCRCGRGVLQLFAPSGYPWRCRQCYNLSYATRQVGLRYRLILKALKVRERLGSFDLGVANPFPVKPKGMHWRRYDRLRARHDRAVRESIGLLKPSFSKLGS
jgi:hypothetical protein